VSSTVRARQHPLPLLVDTIGAHRWGILTWILGGGAAMAVVAVSFAREVSHYAGGAEAMASSLLGAAQAMRLMRWPAERLDTLGGYLTYHNVTLFALGLAVYGAVQGGHAVRGAEARGVPAEILSTGRSRPGVLLDRALGFAATLALISAGIGAGIALAMAVGGHPDPAGSFITALALAAVALVAYAFGVLVSQLTPSPRAGTGVAALVMVSLYLLTNVWEEIGPLGAVRFVSPFHYANYSRALVPGHGLHPWSLLGLVVASSAMLAAAAWAFQRRDEGAGLWAARVRPDRSVRRVQRPALHSVWAATLLRQRVGLAMWSLAAAGYLAVMAWMEPGVADMWDDYEYTQRIVGNATGSIPDQYLNFAGQLIVPFVAAYVITQAAGWVTDLRQGRVELILAGPLSWHGLIRQRLVATLLGTAVITLAGVAGLAGASAGVGVGADALGLARLVADTLLVGAALGAVAALVVAWLRNGAAVGVLACYVAASFLLVYLVPVFGWPNWIGRASIFGAFGNPYLEIPAWTGLTVLVAIAALGGLLAAAVAQRSPKVAT
jgi:ABC-2 type transport system permease protein